MDDATGVVEQQQISKFERARRAVGAEIRPMLALSGPVVVAELGWMAMGLVDTLMVAPLGAEAIGAVGLGTTLYMAVAVFGIGLVLGLDTLVSRAFGEGNRPECHRWMIQGCWIALAVALPLMGLVQLLARAMGPWGLAPGVFKLLVPYLTAVNAGTIPLLIYSTIRRHSQAMSRGKPVMVVLFVANVLNLGANHVLVHGHYGFPNLGVVGSGCATAISRLVMAAILVLVTIRLDGAELKRISLRPDLGRLKALMALGLPVAIQIALEVGVFATAGAFAGWLHPSALAAHQIVLNVSSLTFMIPLGISAAGAVRVGQALGRRDPQAAGVSGWTAILFGLVAMTGSGLSFVLAPRALASIFTDDGAVVGIAASLLAIAACFQLFDGLQAVAGGALRGLGDTRTPMLCNGIAHWLVGLPLGYALAFPLGLGILGLWVGLATGLIIAGLVLLLAWARAARALQRAD